DTKSGATHLCIPERHGIDISEIRGAFFDRLAAPVSGTASEATAFRGKTGNVGSNVGRDQHMDAVEVIREYIARGDVYQVNLCQRFQMDFSGSPWEFFQSLFERNPAPFYAYIQAGDH